MSFGFGAKLGTFLSKHLEVTSMREGKFLTYIFEDGMLKDTKKGKSKDHGTITKFTLDTDFIRVDEVDPKDLQERLHEKSYCFPDLKLTFIQLHNGKEVKSVTYEGNTLVDLAKKCKPETDILEVHDERKVSVLRNFTDEEIVPVKVIVDGAFAYSEQALDADTDAMIVSYANSIKTYDGGMHVQGLKDGFVKYFKEVVIPKMSKKDQEATPITPSDITAGLCGVISVKLSKPIFSAQFKSRLTNQEAKAAVRDAVYEMLVNAKPGKVNPMIDFVKRVTKGRVASKKVRKKDMDNAFSKDRPQEYKPIVYNLKTTHPECLLVEGGHLVA